MTRLSEDVRQQDADPAPSPSAPPRTIVYAGRSRRRPAAFRYAYCIHDLVSIGSDVRLPELTRFRTPAVAAAPDISIRVSPVGRRRPRRTVGLSRQLGTVVYEEHLGMLGANFAIGMDERIDVRVSPLLARSPHVVYTNVVEALLRFVLASRDRILLHAATLRMGSEGIMLSAETDTGKTTTILRLIRHHGASFLSDDMTIVDRDGTAHTYPKPLTISAHTLRAVDGRALTRMKRIALAGQSRIHSRSGRSVGKRLGDMNLPIMSINALTQIAVPPPKFRVDELVDCTTCNSTSVDRLFLIERGEAYTGPIDAAEAVETLLRNTDDAYGFPPYRYIAPAIVIGERDHAALCRAERDILTAAIERVSVQRVARDDFSWSEWIAESVRDRQNA